MKVNLPTLGFSSTFVNEKLATSVVYKLCSVEFCDFFLKVAWGIF